MRDGKVERHTGDRSRRRTARAAFVALIAPMLAAACSSGASQQIDDLSSTAAAARLIAADRLAGSVPSHYSHRLLANLADEVKTTTGALKPGSLPSSISSSTRAASNALEAVIRSEGSAVEANDAPRLHAAMDRAQALHDRLQALSQQAEAAER